MRSLVIVGILLPSLAAARPRTIVLPANATIELRFDDGVIVPAPRVTPRGTVLFEAGYADAAPYPHGILLLAPPVPERAIAAFGVFEVDVFGLDRVASADVSEPPDPWLVAGLIGTGVVLAGLRRRTHPIGELV
ncbi:MAG: hypothetical protein NT062_28305 [Proteobacteria bacterium]|nr:hypothetical protein [Pseudomonadota bacterium]